MSIAVWVGLIALLESMRNRGVHVALPRPRYNDRKAKGQMRKRRRPKGSDRRWSRQTPSTESHDRGRHVHGIGPHHVVYGSRFRRDAQDCCADDRRNFHLLHPGTGRLSGNL